MGGMPGMMGGMPGMGGGQLPPGFMGGMGGKGGGRGGRSAPEQTGVLPPGTKVFVRGLQGAPQHNGKTGQVEEFDASAGRYMVALPDGDVLRIRYDNLLQNARCEVVGMQNRAELNGKSATLVGFD